MQQMSQNNDPKIGSTINYFEDAQQPSAEEPATLERLSSLAVEAKELEARIAQMTVDLAEEQGKLDKILKGHIPSIMEQLGLEEFKLKDGSKVTVKQDIKCGITEERKPAAFAWLADNEYDGIIKTGIALAFGKGEIADAERAIEVLHEAGFGAAELDKSIHPSTLKSFVKERLEAGDNIPLDTFGVFDFKVAKIALPRTRK